MLRKELKFIILVFGLNSCICIDLNGRKDKPTVGRETVKVKLNKRNNVENYELNEVPKTHETFFNPVLQNHSVLFEYLNIDQDKNKPKSRNVRKKRSRSRRCSGLCESSLCTWREVWDEERTRVPQFIKYAVCDSARCNFDFAGLDNAANFALQINTYCDLVKIDMQVTENGESKWITDWPIACACSQRTVDVHESSFVAFRHPGRDSHSDSHSSLGRINVDITNNESVMPVSRQRIVLNDARHRPLTRAQRRRLRNQRRNMQNTESWEQIMDRRRNRP